MAASDVTTKVHGRVVLNMLGPVQALRGRAGDALDLGGVQQRRLLAVLVAGAPRVVPSARLVEVLWPDGETANPDASLRAYVSRLRRSLVDADVLVTEAPGYRIDMARVELDIDRFTELAAAARAELAAGRAAEAADRAVLGLGLWRGRAYAEFAEEPWAIGDATRLEELRLGVADVWADALLALGRHAAALPELRRWVAEHPLRPRLVGGLALALYRAGNHAEAVRVLAEHRSQLAEETGLLISTELEQLERRILAQDPTLDLDAVPGTPLRGYLLGAQLGEGAFGQVFVGTQPSVGRDVAVKVIRSELANRPEFIRRFEAEAHLVARLEHPHIVPLYDYWREPDRACLVMRYLRGGTLEAHLAARGPLDLDAALTMATQVGTALEAAHRVGVVHRDVKAANIFLDGDGNYYLGDFGIALEAAEAADPESALSAGSPAYASPEQLRRLPVGPTADVHGLGITLYEALTGQLPFPHETTRAGLLRRQLEDPIPGVRETRRDLPPAIDDVLATATAKDPTLRFPSAAELVVAVRAALTGDRAVGGAGGTVGQVDRGSATAITLDDRNPYKGLRAFTEADEGDFFGRARLVDQLVALLERAGTAGRVVAVVGPSGIGKSSVVRAGLLPALRRGAVAGAQRWFTATMVPGREPFEELAAALRRVAVDVPLDLADQLAGDHRGLDRAVRAIAGEGGDVLVVIDQFEELFTQTVDEALRRRFLDALHYALTDQNCPIRLVLTLRADFYDRPLRYGEFAQLLRDSTVSVLPLQADELERAVVDPAARVGAAFEPGLVSQIVADVADHGAALPILQYALTELYEQRVSGLMTMASYVRMGGVAGALTRRAEELYSDADAAKRAAARRLFGRLVTLGEGVEDTRRRVRVAELGDDAAMAAVIERFSAARLLSLDRDVESREPTVEVSHEALIRQWPRLRDWLSEDRDALRLHRQLGTAAAAWERSGNDPGELYRGGRLEAAEQWLAANPAEPNPLELAFVEQSVALRRAEAAAQARGVRRLRRAFSAVAAVAVIALVAATVAAVQQQRATTNAERADANATAASDARRFAEIGELAAQAAAVVRDDRQLALLLAVEAHRREPSIRTLGALQQVLSSTGPFLGVVGAGRSFNGAGWVADGTIVAVGADGIGRYDPKTGEERWWVAEPVGSRVTVGGDSNVRNVALAATALTGVTVAAGSDARSLRLHGPDGRSTPLFGHPTDLEAVAIAPSGASAATLDRTGTLRIFDLPSGTVRHAVTAYPEVTLGDQLWAGIRLYAPFAPDSLRQLPRTIGFATLRYAGDDAVVGNSGLAVRRWDVATGERTAEGAGIQVFDGEAVVDTATGTLAAVLPWGPIPFPDGQRFAWHTNHRVAVSGWNSGTPTAPIAGFDVAGVGTNFSSPKIYDLALGDDGFWVLSSDGRLQQLDASGRPLLEVTAGVRDPMTLTMEPTGGRLAVTGADGVAIVAADGTQLIARAGPRGVTDHFTMAPDATWAVAASTNAYDVPAAPVLDLTDTGVRPRAGVGLGRTQAAVLDSGHVFAFRAPHTDLLDPVTFADQVRLEALGNFVALSISPDGRWAATGSTAETSSVLKEAQVLLLDTATGKRVATHTVADDVVQSVSIHPDGTRLLVAFRFGPPRLFTVPGLAPVESPGLQDLRVTAARWSSDGRWLFTVDERQQVTVRDPVTFAAVSTLRGSRVAQGIGFVPVFAVGGGERVLSVVNDAPALWDVRSGEPIGTPFPMSGGVSSDGADGHDVAISALGRHVLIWDLAVDGWPEIACRAAGRNFTRDEWARYLGEDPYRATCPAWPDAR